KYVIVAMSIDNDGEGGILALLSLLGVKRHHRPAVITVGLFGAALIYGDGAITPAISVLSALEGLNIAVPAIASYVLPAAVLILIALFAVQSQGAARIGARSARSWLSGSLRSRCLVYEVSSSIRRCSRRSTRDTVSPFCYPEARSDFWCS